MALSLGLRLPALKALGLAEGAAFARTVGLAALDLPADYAAAAQVCRDQGLRIGTVDGVAAGQVLNPDDGVRERAVQALCAQISALPMIGAGVLFLCLVPEDRTQPIARSLALFTETFPPIVAACEAAGVRIALEGWPGPAPTYPTLGYTPEVWRAMFHAIPSPTLGLCYDPSHLVRLGIDYLRVLDEFGPRIHHCHGKDTDLLPEAQYLYGHLVPALDDAPAFSGGAWRYCVPGAGVVQWTTVAFGLERVGFEGCVSIELEDARYHGTLDREQQGIIKAYEHLARCVA